jgi:small-conductance mechanosensitive channel
MKDQTNKERLLRFLTNYKIFTSPYIRTSTIQKWGSDNYVNEPTRIARTLRSEGYLVRISEKLEKICLGFDTAEDIYLIK